VGRTAPTSTCRSPKIACADRRRLQEIAAELTQLCCCLAHHQLQRIDRGDPRLEVEFHCLLAQQQAIVQQMPRAFQNRLRKPALGLNSPSAGNLHRAAMACGVRRYIQRASGFFLEPGSGVADDPSPVAVWLPAFARFVGAPAPPRITTEEQAPASAGEDASITARIGAAPQRQV
jgi:hypothetical protein